MRTTRRMRKRMRTIRTGRATEGGSWMMRTKTNEDDDGGGGEGGDVDDDDDGHDNDEDEGDDCDAADDDDYEHRHRDDTRGDDEQTQAAQTGWTSTCVRGYARFMLAVWAGRGAHAASCLVILLPSLLQLIPIFFRERHRERDIYIYM